MTVKSFIRKTFQSLGYSIERFDQGYPVIKGIQGYGVEILADPEFQASCRECEKLTLLDTPRLANLWAYCRMSNPKGAMIEVGSYLGGGALHLSNCCPDRLITVCDSFEGFKKLDTQLDNFFDAGMFKDSDRKRVADLFESRGRNARVIKGFFPQSCAAVDLKPLSFAHLDVDVYEATLESLAYLDVNMIKHSFIVLDDFNRRADGVNKAVREFISTTGRWRAFPMFPGQAVLIHHSWFSIDNGNEA